MDAATRRTLRRLARTRTPEQLAALFAAIRSHDDAALLAAPAKTRRRNAGFAEAQAARLAPIVAPAAEKAEMLLEAFAERHGPVSIRPDGLLPTIRRLAAQYGEDTVAAAVDALMARLAQWGSTRERVT